MSDTAMPNVDRRTAGPQGRRKTDVLPRAATAARRTRMVQMALLAVAAIITIDAVVGDKGMLQTFRARRESAQIEAQISDLHRRNAAARERIRRLREDLSAIEEAARRDLGMVKPGEVLVIVRDAEKR